MGTGFTMGIGYISGYTYEGDADEAFKALRDCLNDYIESGRFENKLVLRYGTVSNGETVAEYARIYKALSFNPLKIEVSHRQVFIMCSGGGESRRLKELAALMLCADVITELALQGIPVYFNIA
jgi:hypothetical protein